MLLKASHEQTCNESSDCEVGRRKKDFKMLRSSCLEYLSETQVLSSHNCENQWRHMAH